MIVKDNIKKHTSVPVKDIIQGIVNELSSIIETHLEKNIKTCINCVNFNEPSESCTLYKAKPPARVIALGCEKWEDIPF